MDALKVESHYCKNPPAEGYKNKVTCSKADLAGFFVPVFTDRLCNNVQDCPGLGFQVNAVSRGLNWCPVNTHLGSF
mgnify:CR=1 FL=1